MAKIILSGFSDEYSSDIHVQISMLKEQGFDAIEPRFIGKTNVADLTEEEAVAIRKELDENGLAVSSIGSPIGKIKLSDDFDAHLVRAENTFKVAKILGADKVRMFSFYLRDGQTREEARAEVIEKLGKLIDLAEKYGITLCHENEANIYGENPEMCLDILEAFNGRLGCVFDMGNFVFCNYYPYPKAYNMLKPYIDYFHIKDSFPNRAVVPPGCGEAQIKTVLADYGKETSKEVILTLEPHLHAFVGLKEMTANKIDQPYSYANSKEAFLDAAHRLQAIVAEIQKEA